jgi:hypothetical protein
MREWVGVGAVEAFDRLELTGIEHQRTPHPSGLD